MIRPPLQPRDQLALSIPLPQAFPANALEFHIQPRYVLHVLIVLLAIAVAALTKLGSTPSDQASSDTGWWFGRWPILSSSRQSQYLSNPILPFTISRSPITALTGELSLPAAPALEASKDRPMVLEHVVSAGETVSGIAEQYGISTETILWANNLQARDLIGIGDKLKIPAVSGVLHTVKEGDTLGSIAERYGVDQKAIVDYRGNDLSEPFTLHAGQLVMVPGGRMPDPPRPAPVSRGAAPAPENVSGRAPSAAPASGGATGRFAWPTAGPIFTYFGAGHAGIDISPPYGTPIYAADGGRVISVLQWDYSYGWHLIIDHGNGYQTLYAHASRFNVSVGDYVDKGQLIAWVGSTGKSTGPHLHFEIHLNGVAVDPLKYLP